MSKHFLPFFPSMETVVVSKKVYTDGTSQLRLKLVKITILHEKVSKKTQKCCPHGKCYKYPKHT